LSPIYRAIESVDKLQLLYVYRENFAQALNCTISIIFVYSIDLSNITIKLLYYTADKTNSKVLYMMLEYQHLDVEERETTGDMWTPTPLMKAIYNEDEECVEILLRHRADPKAELRNLSITFLSTLRLCIAYWHKNTRIASRLISLGVDVNHNKDPSASDTPLVYTLFNNQFHIADLLLRHGASLSHCAPNALHGNVLGELLYAQPSRLIHNAISFVASHPLKPSIPFVAFPAEKKTVFHSLCSMNELRRKCLAPADFLAMFALLRQIFPEPYLVSIPDANDLTPLHYAAWVAFPEAVRVLLEAGADPFYCAGPRTTGEGDMPPIPRGMSVVEMVREGEFCPLVGFGKLNVEEMAEWEERRSRVRALIEVYM
jgi:ankyrin repeat protein